MQGGRRGKSSSAAAAVQAPRSEGLRMASGQPASGFEPLAGDIAAAWPAAAAADSAASALAMAAEARARPETSAAESVPSWLTMFLGDAAGYVVGRAPVVSPAFGAPRDRVATALGHVVYLDDWTRVVGSGKHASAAYNEARSRTLLMDGWRTTL